MATTLEPISIDLTDGRQIVLHEARRCDPAEDAFGAYHDGELVGMVVCDEGMAPTGHIVIVVKPEWRGVGVGQSLLRRMVERARELGFTFLTISHDMDNESAWAMLAASDLVVARRVRKGVVKAALHVPAAASNSATPTLAA
jgi:ribosomal protein S18 acetylase RimI-like enzyme